MGKMLAWAMADAQDSFMPQPRFLAPWKDSGDRAAIYHCTSRVVDRQMVLQRAEEEQGVRFMRPYEEFSGVQVLSFCVMTNHFHLLVHVPPRPGPPQASVRRPVTERERTFSPAPDPLQSRELPKRTTEIVLPLKKGSTRPQTWLLEEAERKRGACDLEVELLRD